MQKLVRGRPAGRDGQSVFTSPVCLFTDDCLLYRPIRSVADQQAFQCDVEALERWASTWGMRFKSKKCYLLNITPIRNHLTHNYSLNNHILQTVTREKYLGVTISNDLNCSTHINTITNKSNSKFGFLRRNLRRCPKKLKETTYLSLVIPTLEYAASVWDPRLVKYLNSLEAVQRKAASFVHGNYSRKANPTNMLNALGWKTLDARRRDTRLQLLHNITHNNTAVSAGEIRMVEAECRTKANHHFKFRAI